MIVRRLGTFDKYTAAITTNRPTIFTKTIICQGMTQSPAAAITAHTVLVHNKGFRSP
jgi:hypothetical protein